MRCLIALLALAALPAVASSSAWTSYLKIEHFTDLVALPDQVWGATAEAGLVRFDRATGLTEAIRREPGVLGSNQLSRLAVDPAGRLWVGTRGAGVSRLTADGLGAGILNVLDGVPGDTVSVLEAQGDTMWIGTTEGVALWDGRQITGSLPDANTVSFDTTFASASVTGIEPLGDTLWLATRRGVGFARLSTQLTDWRPMNAGLASLEVTSLASDGTSLFARAGGAVYRFLQAQQQWEADASVGVARSLVDDQGVVLVVGDGGMLRWNGSDWTAIAGAPVSGASGRSARCRRPGPFRTGSRSPPEPTGSSSKRRAARGSSTRCRPAPPATT